MAAYYLAVDIGASSGRHIIGHMENGKMVLEEIYRFENGMVKKDGELCWEFDRLFKEVVNGLKKCKEIGKIPVSMGVDTWGVDFVLLDKNDNVLGNTVGYREIEALLGSSARYATANINAFSQLAWTADDIEVLTEQWRQTVGIREIPGGYYTGRHITNAVRKVINDQEDPRETIIDYTITINEEIAKKRSEFGLPLE